MTATAPTGDQDRIPTTAATNGHEDNTPPLCGDPTCENPTCQQAALDHFIDTVERNTRELFDALIRRCATVHGA